ncbi:MAG: hypothetical protein WAK31_07125 [Chthoniobacterales bacterium]
MAPGAGRVGANAQIATDFSGGMVRDNPEINKRVADMMALGRAGVLDDVGPVIAALLFRAARERPSQARVAAAKA